ncbi:hypothetical protein BWQ96_04225 [Gracilariopsis chorda]|uniref:Uncharacterized protein n=1 Tax=Gracilariopsis chorda TaxID=448386 RepID=A0A2V3IY40_9FLOR|nr:hypothetical protein BWQ96_04225 [Gracilariopsis chorda]|eukprot:PXF46050.1 hypothetical protein BWQ96_04225 [Gracilariopsis chorda]
MKFEPLRYKEKTIEFFGKKGISWNCTVVFYLSDDYGSDVENTSPHHLYMLFYDHIVQGDTQKDVSAVASLLNEAVMRLKEDLPKLREVVVLSDNAACYQSITLPIILSFIAKANGFSLLRFMQTKRQDGKSMVDARFAIAMTHVSKIFAEGLDIKTPSTLVKALRAGGGMNNTAAELIRFDQENIKTRAWDNRRGQNKNRLPWIGRNNEKQYLGWCASWKRVSARCNSYSTVGTGRDC